MTGDGPWGEDLPYAWRRVPAKALFAERRELCHADDKHLTPSQKYGVLPQDEYMERTGSKVVLNLAGQDSMKHVEPDDFIIHLRSFQGGFEHSRLAGKISTAYTVLRARGRIHSAYYRWLFKSDIYISALAGLTNQLRDGQSIKFGDFARIDLPLPPPEDQRRIADFLDHQVALLDRAVDLRQQQMGLLAERRTRLAATATTVGLQHQVDTRPTGIPWMPVMASDWTLTKVGRSFRTGSGTTPQANNSAYFDGGIPWVNTGDLRDGPVIEPKRTVSEAALAAYSALKFYEPGALLVAMYGATIGRLGRLAVRACVNQACCVLYDPTDVDPDYAFYWFLGHRASIVELAAGGGQPNINAETVRSLRIPAPSLTEQRGIVDHLRAAENHILGLTRLFERQMGLLQERKQALITAAVTGQFDVTTARSVA